MCSRNLRLSRHKLVVLPAQLHAALGDRFGLTFDCRAVLHETRQLPLLSLRTQDGLIQTLRSYTLSGTAD